MNRQALVSVVVVCAYLGFALPACANDPSSSGADDPAKNGIRTEGMPIGIPPPPFGIAEKAGPPTGVLPTSAAVSVPAGSVLTVSGTYGAANLSCEGTATNPAFVVGSPGHSIEAPWIVNGQYCILENLVFKANAGRTTAGRISIVGHHIALRNSDLSGYRERISYGIGVFGGASDVVIYRNKSHDHGDVNATFDQDSHGAVIADGALRVWFLENEFWGSSGNGIQINGGRNGHETVRFIYLGRNVGHDNKQNAFGCKQASDVIWSENVSYNNRSVTSGAGLGAQYAPDRVWWLYNRIYSSNRGIRVASNSSSHESNLYLIGNVAWNIHATDFNPRSGWSNACWSIWGGTNRYLVNNTCYDADSGFRTPGGGAFTIAGNIFAKIRPDGNHLFNEGASRIITARNNLTDTSLLSHHVPSCDDCIDGDPRFTNPEGGDFTLQSVSPAVDKGTEESVYATFQSLYGLDIRRDAAGNVRPKGRAWDIGAYER